MKLAGDLLQRMDDRSCVERFIANQLLSVSFSVSVFVIFMTN